MLTRYKRKYRSPEQRHKRRYCFYQGGFFVLLLLMAVTVYCNYDYWLFKLLMADNYIFTETLDQVYAEAVGQDNVKGYFQDFDRMVMASVTDTIRAANGDRYTYLYTPQRYKRSKATDKADAQTARIEALSDQTVYLYIPNIHKLTRKFVYENKETLAQYPNLILDLRSNYGGLLADFYRIADLFVEKGTVMGYEQMRIPFLSHAVKAKRSRHFQFDQIIILQDENTASAAEGLISALKKHVPNVTLMGEQTFGKGIGQVTLPLTDGYAIRATVLLIQGPDGVSIHQTGIAPDITPDSGDWLAAALALVEE